MRQYIQILFGLLLPLSGLFMVVSTLYYNQNNDFSEALKLGVLTGFLIAIFISPFIAFFIYLMRRPKRIKNNVSKNTKSLKQTPIKRKNTQKKKKINLSQKEKNILSSSDEKIILLMDQELTINVMLYAINEQNIGKVSQTKGEEHSVKINTDEGVIELIVSSLTRHTSEITIESGKDSKYIGEILSYIKEKEYSFLDY